MIIDANYCLNLIFTPIMWTPFQSQKKALVAGARDCGRLDCPDLRMLLDHVAEELAKEYVRLMKVWVEREVGK